MNRPDFDVIVAGAGAGGAAAAWFLTQAGLRVLMVEKARLPRYKPCGGAVPRPTLDRFPFAFDSVIKSAPTDVHFTFPGQLELDITLTSQPIIMVKRSEFDSFLLARSGAEVLEGVAVTGASEDGDRVQVRTGDRSLTARYLVGADGATLQVARCLGLRRKRQWGGSLDGDRALGQAFGNLAVFAMGSVSWGYSWVVALGNHLSVAIVRVRQGRTGLRAALDREMERLGILLDGLRVFGHPVPCYQTPPWPWGRGFPWRAAGSLPQETLSTRRHVLDILTQKASYEGIGRRLLAAAIGWLLFGNRTGDEARI